MFTYTVGSVYPLHYTNRTIKHAAVEPQLSLPLFSRTPIERTRNNLTRSFNLISLIAFERHIQFTPVRSAHFNSKGRNYFCISLLSKKP